MKTNNKINILFILGFILVVLPIISNNSFSGNPLFEGINIEDNDNTNLKSPKGSGYWTNFSFIHIDGNWSTAAGYDWCDGDGSWGNPYIIENITIDATDSPTGQGIYISNSKNDYFIIRNCTIYNAGSWTADAGIKLQNTNNGTLYDNSCSNNAVNGITLINNCNNNSISENNANENGESGILLDDNCDDNRIIRNIANKNEILGMGIYLVNGCDNNTISGTITNDNGAIGIALDDNCDNNTISGNTASRVDTFDQWWGIGLFNGCDNNTLLNNSANDNDQYGIYIYGNCYDNIIFNNTASNTITNYQNRGIFLELNSRNNIIFNNTVEDNTQYGIYLTSNCNDNIFYLNNINGNGQNAEDDGSNNQWDNGSIGNYWDDYDGYDTNGDGIGETPYNISGSSGSQDNFPIWSTPDSFNPIITIITPLANDLFGRIAPDFTLSIDEYLLNTTWYTLDAGLTNHSFVGFSGTINQSVWSMLSNGTIIIRFYANDTSRNLGFEEIAVRKDVIAPNITIIEPLLYQKFKYSPPNFTLSIAEAHPLDTTWYTIDGGTTNITFTGLSGTINLSSWDNLSEGAITITFYANDTTGNVGVAEITVYKDFFAPIIIIDAPIYGGIYGEYSPIYDLFINESNLISTWYTVDGGKKNITFTELKGTINQTLWNTLPNGYITIRFYARDIAGNVRFEEVVLIKNYNNDEELIEALRSEILMLSVIMVLLLALTSVAIVIVILRSLRKKNRLKELILSEKPESLKGEFETDRK